MSVRKAKWNTDTQFNFGSPTFTNTEVVGSGESASLQLSGVSDSSDNIPYADSAKYTPSDIAKIEVTAGKAILKNLSDAGLVIDLEAYWKMDESTWNGIPNEVIDSSVNTNHGRGIPNADTVAGGKINRAGDFDGGTAEVDIPNNASISFEKNEPFSLQCWVKTSTSGYSSLMSHQDDVTNYGINLQLTNVDKIRMNIVGASGSLAVDSTNTVADNAWHHIVATYDGSELASGVTVYIDGSAETPVVIADALAGSIVVTVPFKLADREKDDQPYTGLLDECAVWSRELTSSEVTELWNGDDNLYVDTKDTSQISPAFVNSWLTATITNTLPANTDIRVLFSVDGRANWFGWNGSAWVVIAGNTVRANATSIADAQTNFSDLAVGDGTLDARVFLYTSDSSTTPEVDNINATSNAGYEISGSYETIKYYPEENTNGVCLKTITFTITTPSGTTATVQARTIDHALEEIAGYQTYNNGDNIDLCGYFIQWKVDFTSTGTNTPILNILEIAFHTLIGVWDLANDNLDIIRKIETGRWKIENNQMVFYDDDGITPLYTFNLKDLNGNLTMRNIFERVPV
jgi:hypothetical protein